MAFVGSHLSLLEGWPEEHSIHLTVFLWWVGAGVSVDKSKRPSTALGKGGHLVEGTAAALLEGVTLALLKVFGQVLGITPSHGTLRTGHQGVNGFWCSTQTRTLQVLKSCAFPMPKMSPSPFPPLPGQLTSPALSSWSSALLHHGAYHCWLPACPL